MYSLKNALRSPGLGLRVGRRSRSQTSPQPRQLGAGRVPAAASILPIQKKTVNLARAIYARLLGCTAAAQLPLGLQVGKGMGRWQSSDEFLWGDNGCEGMRARRSTYAGGGSHAGETLCRSSTKLTSRGRSHLGRHHSIPTPRPHQRINRTGTESRKAMYKSNRARSSDERERKHKNNAPNTRRKTNWSGRRCVATTHTPALWSQAREHVPSPPCLHRDTILGGASGVCASNPGKHRTGLLDIRSQPPERLHQA